MSFAWPAEQTAQRSVKGNQEQVFVHAHVYVFTSVYMTHSAQVRYLLLSVCVAGHVCVCVC